MSFEDITLPESVIIEIYRNSLVELAEVKKEKTIIKSEETASLKYLGKNLKNILVLINYPDVVHLPEEQLDFLSKILIACKLDLSHIAIINTAKQTVNRVNIETLKPTSILIFGNCISDIPDFKDLDFFTPVVRDGVSIITAPELEKFSLPTSEGKQFKNSLWLSLQPFFKL